MLQGNDRLKTVWVIAVHWDPESSLAENETGTEDSLQSNSTVPMMVSVR